MPSETDCSGRNDMLAIFDSQFVFGSPTQKTSFIPLRSRNFSNSTTFLVKLKLVCELGCGVGDLSLLMRRSF